MQKELKPPGFGLPWPVERDEGNVEYKWRLINVPPQRILRLATQMKFRLQEGCGTAWYLLGVMDNGLPRGLASTEIQESLRVLERVAEEANARIVEHVFLPGIEGSTVRVCITSVVVQELTIVETTVLVLGPPNVGKSSLVGVLSTGELDNGRGGALMRVIRHPHEFLQGRTTSTSTRTIGYNARGEPLTEYFGVSPDFPYVAQTWAETLRDKTARLVTLVDSKGDTIHSCTTLRSYCQSYPDALLIVCRPWAEGQDHIGKRTSQGVVSDHPPALYATCGDIAILRLITDCYRPLADFQGLPMFILITAVDVGFEEDLAAAAKAIATCFGKAGPFVPDSVLGTFQNSWTPPPPNAEAQASSFDRCSSPVVLRSSAVSGEGISHLHRLLVNIPKRYSWSLETCKSPLFIVEEVYHRIDGPDIVLGGRVTQGVFSSNPTDTCAGYNVFCGPFPNGVGAPFREVCTDDLAERDWISVRLVSIHVHRIPVQRALAGQRCSFGLIFRPDKTGLTTDEQIRQLGRNMHRGCVVLNSQELIAQGTKKTVTVSLYLQPTSKRLTIASLRSGKRHPVLCLWIHNQRVPVFVVSIDTAEGAFLDPGASRTNVLLEALTEYVFVLSDMPCALYGSGIQGIGVVV